jgi:arylformamidase
VSGEDPVWHYLTGQLRPSFPALFEAYQQESDATSLAAADIAYCPHSRQILEFPASSTPWRATLAYFHAGYWESRDKSVFRFIAPGLLRHGICVALANHPLCPDVTLPDLVVAARDAIPVILAHARGLHWGGERLLTAGHSAGAHLAVEFALFDWEAPSPVAGVGGPQRRL